MANNESQVRADLEKVNNQPEPVEDLLAMGYTTAYVSSDYDAQAEALAQALRPQATYFGETWFNTPAKMRKAVKAMSDAGFRR